MDQHQVGLWRRRFEAERLAGLDDRRRPGRPRIYGHDERLKIVETVTATTPEVESQWSHRLIAEALSDVGISASQIGRILASLDVKPHRVRGWLNRPADPAFHSKAQAVCRLYLTELPADTVLFSVDEKTAMQARSRKRAPRPARPGWVERREFEYVRHGTVSLMAALNVTTGTVHPKIIKRNDSAAFIEFLTELAATVDPAKKIHLILDNGSSHTSKATRKWLKEHPRFTVTYTPCHASRVNMIEIFFHFFA